MPSRKLQRAHAKAQRRKKLLADRRKTAGPDTRSGLAAQVRRALSGPIETCLLHEETLTRGNGMLALVRRTGPRRLAVAMFLLDTFCLGVKDVIFREADEAEIDEMLDGVEQMAAFEEVEPSYARKLLHDLVAYARSIGLEPHGDYAAAEPLFGDVAAEACDTVFEFGVDGRPFYVPGPSESRTQIRRRIELLRRTLGEDGFTFIEADEALDLLDDELDDEWDDPDGYDAERAPDPAEWLALGDGERIAQVEAYHRREGYEMPREQLHATFHVIVENQITLGDELPVRRAIDRLMGEGLTRHEAVHAISCLVGDQMQQIAKHKTPFDQKAYNAAVEQLTAESWRRDYGPEGEEDEGE